MNEETFKKLNDIHLLYSMPYKVENMRAEHYAINEYEKLVYSQMKEIERLNKIIEIKNNRIQQLMKRTRSARIDKAREYIEEKYDYLLCDDTFLEHDERIDSKQIKHILGILDGSDKE